MNRAGSGSAVLDETRSESASGAVKPPGSHVAADDTETEDAEVTSPEQSMCTYRRPLSRPGVEPLGVL
jgi:hypothetical protein